MNFLDKTKFPKLNFPVYALKVSSKQSKLLIWDFLRLSWLVLTPEEWVRQHVLNFLVHELNFKKELLKEEHPVEVGTHTNQRIDIIGYNQQLEAQIIVECKAPQVKIDHSTLDQAVRYNSVVGATYIMLSNGLTHLFFKKNNDNSYSQLSSEDELNLLKQ